MSLWFDYNSDDNNCRDDRNDYRKGRSKCNNDRDTDDENDLYDFRKYHNECSLFPPHYRHWQILPRSLCNNRFPKQHCFGVLRLLFLLLFLLPDHRPANNRHRCDTTAPLIATSMPKKAK